MTTNLAPDPILHFSDNNGNPLIGGQLFTYAAGTSTPQATYTDSTGTTPNSNPIILNARGECACYLAPGQSYKFVLQDASSNLIWTADNQTGIPSSLTSASQTSPTGSLLLPAGTTAQRDSIPVAFSERGNTTTGLLEWYDQTQSAWVPYGGEQAAEISIASAATTAIGGAASANILITGTTAITAFDTVAAGIVRHVRFTGALTLTYNATSLILPGAANIATAAGDCAEFESLGSGNWVCRTYAPASGLPVVSPIVPQIQSLTASVASNALTVNFPGASIAFRNATLANGTTTTLAVGALSITVPNTATLGTVSAVPSQLVVLVAYNAGSPVLCIANAAGGVDMSETSLISPTTISTGATSLTTTYSASAVAANSPYRIVGYINITEATAGTWASAPTQVQGMGGNAAKSIPAASFVRVYFPNGYGSSNTKIARFSSVSNLQGPDITYADNATLGASFTVNTPGIYSMTFFAAGPAGMHLGISRNTTQPTVDVFSLTNALEAVATASIPVSNYQTTVSQAMPLNAGDVIRVHTDGQALNTNNFVQFLMARIG